MCCGWCPALNRAPETSLPRADVPGRPKFPDSKCSMCRKRSGDRMRHGYFSRQNTLPLLGLIGATIRFAVSESVSETQLVPSPTVRGLVCACNVQPRWSAGQDTSRLPLLMLAVRLVGFVATATTPKVAADRRVVDPEQPLPRRYRADSQCAGVEQRLGQCRLAEMAVGGRDQTHVRPNEIQPHRFQSHRILESENARRIMAIERSDDPIRRTAVRCLAICCIT